MQPCTIFEEAKGRDFRIILLTGYFCQSMTYICLYGYRPSPIMLVKLAVTMLVFPPKLCSNYVQFPKLRSPLVRKCLALFRRNTNNSIRCNVFFSLSKVLKPVHATMFKTLNDKHKLSFEMFIACTTIWAGLAYISCFVSASLYACKYFLVCL